MDNKRRFPLVLSGFWLKIIALLTMTIDHIGFLLPESRLSYVFRCIGRLALPLFCFMIAEGAMHTKSFKKYALRLGIMASAISIGIIGSEYIPLFKNNGFSMRDQGIIFVDLLLGAVAIYCLRQKKWYLKLLAVLPIAFSIVSYIASTFESCRCYGDILWFPFFIRTQYGWYATIMIVGFYGAYLLSKLFIKYHSNISGIDAANYQGSTFERNIINALSIIVLIVMTFAYYFVYNLLPAQFQVYDVSIQLFAMIAGAFILLYNGLRGYNKKWFQYGSYLYYPVHMIILYLIFSLL